MAMSDAIINTQNKPHRDSIVYITLAQRSHLSPGWPCGAGFQPATSAFVPTFLPSVARLPRGAKYPGAPTNDDPFMILFDASQLLYRIAVYSLIAHDASEITVLQLPKFKAAATEVIGADGIEAVAVYLIDNPNAGDVIPG